MKIIIFSIIFAISLNLAHAGEIIQLQAEEIKDMLMKNKKDKVIVFFATWCSYCKPIIFSKDLPKDKIIFISVDSDKDAIANCAKEISYDVYHVLPTDDMTNLVTLSQSLGIKFVTVDSEGMTNLSIPYIILLDKDNKVIEEAAGIEDLQKYLK